MQVLKKFASVLLSFAIASTATAVTDDCQHQVDEKELQILEECAVIVGQAQFMLKEQQRSIALRDLLIQEQQKEADALSKELQIEQSKKKSWYNNPYIMFGLGVIVTGIGAATLSR